LARVDDRMLYIYGSGWPRDLGRPGGRLPVDDGPDAPCIGSLRQPNSLPMMRFLRDDAPAYARSSLLAIEREQFGLAFAIRTAGLVYGKRKDSAAPFKTSPRGQPPRSVRWKEAARVVFQIGWRAKSRTAPKFRDESTDKPNSEHRWPVTIERPLDDSAAVTKGMLSPFMISIWWTRREAPAGLPHPCEGISPRPSGIRDQGRAADKCWPRWCAGPGRVKLLGHLEPSFAGDSARRR